MGRLAVAVAAVHRIRTVAAALVFLAAFALVQVWDLALPSIAAAKYQAVFLANGQVFFGRYGDRLGPYATISAPFYIRRPASQPDEATPPPARIVRRGEEPHRPESRMLIAKSAILFVEDLADASSVARFIDEDELKRMRR